MLNKAWNPYLIPVHKIFIAKVKIGESRVKNLMGFMLVLAFLTSAGVWAQGEQDEPLESAVFDGVERSWRIFVPESYQTGTPTPLVLDFHGSGSNPGQQSRLSQFEALAAEEGFIVVTPKGAPVPSNGGRPSWNVDFFSGDPDDVTFVRGLIELLGDQYSIDSDRIFATGMSGGARMSSRVACSLSDIVAAVGPVAGIRFPEVCDPIRSVPIVTFHGKQDRVNHYERQSNSPAYWLLGVEDSIADWVGHNQCDATASETQISEAITRVAYQNCADGGDIVFYRSENAGHTWPGSELHASMGRAVTNMEISATAIIWEFFKDHPMPEAM